MVDNNINNNIKISFKRNDNDVILENLTNIEFELN